MATAVTYLTPLELVTFYDQRRVLELASDTGIPALAADLSSTTSAGYLFIQAAIRTASSDLDTHCQMGKRYTRVNLEAIITAARASTAGDADGQHEARMKRAALLRQLVADLTYGIMMGRRGMSADRMKSLAPRYEDALLTLERLVNGNQVFDIDANISAGVPSTTKLNLKSYSPGSFNPLFGIWPDTHGLPGLFGRW